MLSFVHFFVLFSSNKEQNVIKSTTRCPILLAMAAILKLVAILNFFHNSYILQTLQNLKMYSLLRFTWVLVV